MKKEIKSNVGKLIITEAQLEAPWIKEIIAAGAEIEVISENKWDEMMLKAQFFMEEDEKKEYIN